MSSIQKVGKKWRVQIKKNGVRESSMHDTKAAAQQFSIIREGEITGKILPRKTLSDALTRFGVEVSPTHKGARWELIRLKALAKYDIAAIRMQKIATSDIAAWRDSRLKDVSAATVLRELKLLNSVFEVARREWGWLEANPMKDVRKPKSPPSRRRRVPEHEIEALKTAANYTNKAPENATQLSLVAFLFALETAMRSGEILGLKWRDIGKFSAQLPHTKNGDSREVALSKTAHELLDLLPKTGVPFPIDGGVRDVMFRNLVKKAKIKNMHFHDSRAEAIFRLSKKLNLLELCKMIGQRDPRSLLFYYETTAEELAAKLA